MERVNLVRCCFVGMLLNPHSTRISPCFALVSCFQKSLTISSNLTIFEHSLQFRVTIAELLLEGIHSFRNLQQTLSVGIKYQKSSTLL